MKTTRKHQTGLSPQNARWVKEHEYLWDDSWGSGEPNPQYSDQMDALMPQWQRDLISKRQKELKGPQAANT